MENLSPEKVILIATNIALELTKGKSCDEINIIKNILKQVIETINTILWQKIFLEDKHPN